MKFLNVRTVVCGAALAAAVALGIGPTAGAAGQATDLEKRIAALEAGQKAILNELEEIKRLLQARPAVPLPAPAPMPSPAAAAPAPAKPAAAAPAPTGGVPGFDLSLAGAPMKGRADAKLVVLEFSDFQCPFCGRYSRETYPQVDRDYIQTGKAKYAFRHFPLERLHPLALGAAEAAECANAQGKFWDIHTRLFANQQALTEADLTKTAQALGLNMGTFTQCLATQSSAPTKIRQDQAEGARAAITGTPTFFLGTMTKDGKLHPLRRLVGAQPYAAFKTALDAVLSSPDLAK